MKWVGIVVGGLVGMVALVALVGAVLPRAHTASRTVTLRQPPDSVWAVVRDLGGVPGWWPELKGAERLPDRAGREVWRHTMGNGSAMPLEVVESQAPRRLVTEIAAAPGSPFGGRWIYEIAPAPGGSRVTVTEDGWIANVIFRFVASVTGLHRTIDGYLRALGKRFGEEVRPAATEPPGVP